MRLLCELAHSFLKVRIFGFGGGFAMVPLEKYGEQIDKPYDISYFYNRITNKIKIKLP